MRYLKYFGKHHIASAKLSVVFFYICLSVQIMYIIHNKATFMVKEIINPIIRKSKNSTIMITSSLSIESRFRGNTHTCFILTFYVIYYILLQISISKYYFKQKITNRCYDYIIKADNYQLTIHFITCKLLL